MQTQIKSALQSLQISASELHCSLGVLDEFENLREQLLTYFCLDKYIHDKQQELGIVKEQKDELEELKKVYAKAVEYQQYK